MLLSLTPWWHLLSRIFLPRTRGRGFWWRTLAINQESQVSAVSAAASNLQLLRRDALLKNFGFQPQVLSTVRTAPLEGSHVLGPEPKVLQNRVRAIRQADRMAGSSVMFTQKHRESKSSMKVTSSRKTVFRTPVFDQPGSPTATREEWHRSRPFQLEPAGEPATDPTPTATRSLTRFLRLPQPGNVDGSQVGARLADCPSLVESAGQLPGHCHCRGWGGHCIPATTSAHPSVHQLPDQKQRAGPPASRGCLADEGSHRAGHQRGIPRLLQPVVHGPQEDRRSATCDRSLHSQPPHVSSTLEDGDAVVRPFSHQKSGVDGIVSHTRCLPSCSDAPSRLQVSFFSWSTRKCSLVFHLGWRLLYASS